jgi:hypothetical protein
VTATAIRTADQVLDLLTDIAETGSVIPAPVVRNLAWHGHTGDTLTAAWMDFREAARARAAMLGGTRDWRDLYDGPEVSGLEHAVDLKSAEIDDAYRLVISGPRGGAL